MLYSRSFMIIYFIYSSVTQMVKNLPATQETRAQSRGQEDPLEKGMAVHSSILAWRIPWTEEPGMLLSMCSKRVRQDWVTNTTTTLLGFHGGSDPKASAYSVGDPGSIPGSGGSPGEGNGNPLQYSCLKNPMDGGSW